MFSLNIFQNLVDTPVFFLKGWNIPGIPAKAIMSDRGGIPKYTYLKIGISGGGQNN